MKKSSSILLHPVAEAGSKEGARMSSRKRSASQENGNSSAEYVNGDRERILNCQTLDMNAILVALAALKKGDFGVRLPVTFTSTEGKVADAFNDVAELLSGTTRDLSRVSHVVGKEGKINERLSISGATGSWAERVNSVNTLISCLVTPISETSRVIGAVAKGDLSQSMALEMQGRPLQGEFLRTAKTVNLMVD